jgi:hypothetical protein
MPSTTIPSTDARRTAAPRALIAGLLWAGPIGVVLAGAVLIASTPFFRHGPGVPTAGDGRAWLAIWSALGLVAAGCGIGLIANAAWLAVSWRRAYRPTGREWFRTLLNVIPAAVALWFWFGA